MRRPAKTTAGRELSSLALPSSDARASTRPAVAFIPRTLEAAIDAADLVLREPTDDSERIAVFCNALGGAFIYSGEEVERRISLKYPNLAPDGVAEAARFLENRVRTFLKPIQITCRQKTSWTHGWRGDY